jgi:quinol-cytochrome oxidoreductase complex cytochrome b subunit
MPDKVNKKSFLTAFLDTPFGNISLASFILIIVSGIILLIPFDVNKPLDSISYWLLSNSSITFLRNIHYWAAQLFLISTVLHIIEHLYKSSEKDVKSGVWFRLTLSLFFIFYVMLSGFLLKGDADSEQAGRIIRSLFEQIPFIGNQIAYSLFGKDGDYQIIYVHHIATATIILYVVLIEHAKQFWPKISVFVYTLFTVFIISFFFSANLHDGKNQIVKGPWYFLGLQEILHWTSFPIIIILLLLLLLIIFFYLKYASDSSALFLKRTLLLGGALYIFLTIIGGFFRGENWSLILPWQSDTGLRLNYSPLVNFSDASDTLKVVNVLGRNEGCVSCHNDLKGFESFHSPKTIGCYSCHLGNPYTLNKNFAHKGMVMIPGNLSDANKTCGTSECHPDIVPRINNSIMNTLSGIVSVNKFVFNEINEPDGLFDVKDLAHTNADSHLRNLCASCHLGNQKTELGPINELSRGGGCNACHLNYSDQAIDQLNKYKNKASGDKYLPNIHPQLNLNITNSHCFGCHSRSGRISTNYEGWSETLLTKEEIKDKKDLRVLMDGRVFEKQEADVHFKKGMDCIDCHIAQEVMGAGNLYKHKEDQTVVRCTDCHSNQNNAIGYKELDYESRKIVDSRKSFRQDEKFLIAEKNNIPLINTYLSGLNNKFLITKIKKDSLQLKPPAFVCSEGKAHKRLSCNSCHAEWASYCVGCHTEYKSDEEGYDLLDNKFIKGSWIESSSNFYVDYPSLGVKIDESGKEVIDTFIPGMIIKIYNIQNEKIFKRLFAPAFSHTINKKGRSCESCHNNSLAIGYGRGKLIYDKKGRWSFEPEMKVMSEDGLPEDAWIPFLKNYTATNSTRINARPFNLAEQKSILTVGSCLQCHKSDSRVMKSTLIDFEKVMKSVSSKCILPSWN